MVKLGKLGIIKFLSSVELTPTSPLDAVVGYLLSANKC